MKLYFFGVIRPKDSGHFLYHVDGRRVRYDEEKQLPFGAHILDGGLLRPPQEQGRLHLAIINGWTILGMWDRTGDSRGNSNASFLVEGVHTLEEMKEYAATHFCVLWRRIQGAKEGES